MADEIEKVDALAAEANKNANTSTRQTDTINQMYDAQKQNQLSQLETAYNLNKSNMQAAADKIPTAYQNQANDLAAQYEKNKRNFNMQAAANGINTGTASQAELAQNAVYQRDYGKLRTAEADAATEAQRNLNNLEMQYQANISQALATNDYNKAAALLDEYKNQYTRDLDKAKVLAQYGDFSGYANIPEYGQEAADAMKNIWVSQNPDLAVMVGAITPAQRDNIKNNRPMNEGLDASGNKVAPVGGGGGDGLDNWNNPYLGEGSWDAHHSGGQTPTPTQVVPAFTPSVNALETAYNYMYGLR